MFTAVLGISEGWTAVGAPVILVLLGIIIYLTMGKNR